MMASSCDAGKHNSRSLQKLRTLDLTKIMVVELTRTDVHRMIPLLVMPALWLDQHAWPGQPVDTHPKALALALSHRSSFVIALTR